MEFLRNCATNAMAVGDWAVVTYRSYLVTPPHPSPNPEDSAQIAEAHFRSQGYLTTLGPDTSRSSLWFFERQVSGQTSGPPEPLLAGYTFSPQSRGEINAAELARCGTRNLQPSGPVSTASPSLREHNGIDSELQKNNGPFNGPSATLDLASLYDLFLTAVLGTLSYSLSLKLGLVPLGPRTFASPSAQWLLDGSISSSEHFQWLTLLDVVWVSGGTLTISLKSVRRPDLCPLDTIRHLDLHSLDTPILLYVAPTGRPAILATPDNIPADDLTGTPAASSGSSRRRRDAEAHAARWKHEVARWLRAKGVCPSNLYRDESWVMIRMNFDLSIRDDSPQHNVSEFLWPSALCYAYRADSSPYVDHNLAETCSTSQPSEAEHRLGGPAEDSREEPKPVWGEGLGGLFDPLFAAESWLFDKAERERTQGARRKTREHEESAHVTEIQPSSPLHSRTGAYVDVQSVTGVYPTPPDGLAIPGNGSANGHDLANQPSSDLGGATEAEPRSEESHQPLAAASDRSGYSTEKNNEAGTDVQHDVDHDMSFDDGNDDLFEDMDEDVFGANDVTEADFNFFDEPGSEGFEDFLDFPKELRDKSRSSTLPSGLEADVLVDRSDIASGFNNTSAKEVRVHGSDEHLSFDNIAIPKDHAPAPTKGNQEGTDCAPNNHFNETRTVYDNVLRTPLGAQMQPEEACIADLESGATTSVGSKRGSLFSAVSFGTESRIADSKYHSNGRFSFLAPTGKYSPVPQHQRPGFQREASEFSLQRNSDRYSSLEFYRSSILSASLRHLPQTVAHPSTEPMDVIADSDTSSEIGSIGSNDLSDDAGTPYNGGEFSDKRKWRAANTSTPISTCSAQESRQEPVGAAIEGLFRTSSSLLDTLEPSSRERSLTDYPLWLEAPNSYSRHNLRKPYLAIEPIEPLALTTQHSTIPDIFSGVSPPDIVNIVQMLADQVIHSTLDILPQDDHRAPWHDTFTDIRHDDDAHRVGQARSAIKEVFPSAVNCNIVQYAEIKDVLTDPVAPNGNSKVVQRRTETAQGSNNEGSMGQMNPFFKIRPPHIRIRRADTLWEMLPTALSYWDALGLSPASGPKNIAAYCVYPSVEVLTDSAKHFLRNIGIVYESSYRMGSHSPGNFSQVYEGGLVPVVLDTLTSTQSALRAFRETCIQLGTALASITNDSAHRRLADQSLNISAFVIYLINPFKTPEALVGLCAAFWNLFQAYKQMAQPSISAPYKPDIVLQIVPLKHVGLSTSSTTASSRYLETLAREVYDRCPPSVRVDHRTSLNIPCTPWVHLEETIPKSIIFKLQPEPPADIMLEGSYLHLGYSLSSDRRWITAAWTDNFGKNQATASYCITGSHTFAGIAKEMWQTSLDIMQGRQVNWRLCIAKAGVLDRSELDVWKTLTVTIPTPLCITAIVLAIDMSPPLCLYPLSQWQPLVSEAVSSGGLSSTPGSTPQPGVSPDQFGLASSTIPFEAAADLSNESNAVVVDPSDDTWGVILGHRRNSSRSLTDYRPALISGLLVKRGEEVKNCNYPNSTYDPGPILVGVNILWLGTNPRPGVSGYTVGSDGGSTNAPQGVSAALHPAARLSAESLLKDILTQFRGLGLVAKLKGMKGTKFGAIPWHIAAAVRGVEALETCF